MSDLDPYREWRELTLHLSQAEVRIEKLEAKLEKAVEALEEAVYLLDPDEEDMTRQAGVYRIVTTLAEMKGKTDD